MSRFGTPLAALVAATFVLACSSDDSDDASNAGGGGTAGGGTGGSGTGGSGMQMPTAVTFTDDIHPILLAKCGTSGCHDGSQEPFLPGHGAADVEEAYAATQATSSLGGRVYERILERITSEDPSAIMPPPYPPANCGGAIGEPGCVTQAELDLIEAWIAAGTPL